MPLDMAVQSFGGFLRYHVSSSATPQEPQHLRVDAFQLMMSSSRQQSLKLPRKKEPPRNQKDKLFNGIVDLLDEQKLSYSPAEAESSGQNLVRVLTDCLWHIDGHHETLEKQSCPVPPIFGPFTGYNLPERSKHRKRTIANLSSDTLKSLSRSLFSILQGSYWKCKSWQTFGSEVESLAGSLAQYVDYLERQNKKAKLRHASDVPIRQLSNSITLTYIKATTGSLFPSFRELSTTLEAAEPYQHVFLNDLCPGDPRRRYEFIQSLERTGVESSVVVCTHSSGNNTGNMHFVWRVPKDEEIERVFIRSQSVIESIRPQFPIFHTRTMREAMFSKFGRIASSVKPAVLRHFYRDLTGDSTAANVMVEEEVDTRVKQFLEMEPDDPQTIFDLREVRCSEKKTKHEGFWAEAEKFINEDIGTAVDDRRHCQVTHLAKAVSIRDFREQVSCRCPEGSAIPSEEWIRLQFWPKNVKTRATLHHTGRLKVRFMVQARQFERAMKTNITLLHCFDIYANSLFDSRAYARWSA